MVLHDINELAFEFGSDADRLKNDFSRYSGFGGQIDWTDRTVTIGSIVEEAGAEFKRTYEFPVYLSEIDCWMDELYRLTQEAWNKTNGE